MGVRRGLRRSGKATAEEHLALDVRKLQKHGLLVKAKLSGWRWALQGGQTASVTIQSGTDIVRLTYMASIDSEGRRRYQVLVPLERLACHLGGERVWFRCPRLRCRRRVALLYFRKADFACRHCHQLAYECQRENTSDRALRRSAKLRLRLGGSPALADDFPLKPKGMHWRTYERYCQLGDHLDWLADQPSAAMLKRLASL